MKTPSRVIAWGTGLLLLLSVALAAPPPAELQPGPPPLAILVKPLGLTAAQQSKLAPVFTAARVQMAADLEQVRRSGQKLAEPEVMDLIRTREADLRERLVGLLTAEQLASYDQLTATRMPRRSETVPVHGHHEMDTPQTAR
jgi:hypothetical protein